MIIHLALKIINSNFNYSRLKLSNLACKSASASDGVIDGVTAPPFPPAPIADACGCLLPVATDNEPDAYKITKNKINTLALL